MWIERCEIVSPIPTGTKVVNSKDEFSPKPQAPTCLTTAPRTAVENAVRAASGQRIKNQALIPRARQTGKRTRESAMRSCDRCGFLRLIRVWGHGRPTSPETIHTTVIARCIHHRCVGKERAIGSAPVERALSVTPAERLASDTPGRRTSVRTMRDRIPGEDRLTVMRRERKCRLLRRVRRRWSR